MASKIDRRIKIDCYVIALSKVKYSFHQIIQGCKNRSYFISKKGVYNTLNIKGRKHLNENDNLTAKLHSKNVRTW